METVVLDNASQDGSAEAIAEAFPEVQLVRMPKNYGDWEGRDIGAANCHGEYLFSLDNDAIAEPDTVEKLVARMEREPELAVAQTRVVDPKTGEAEGVGGKASLADIDHYRATFLGGAAMIRMSCLRAAGGFPHYLLGGGEPFLSYRFLDMGLRILHCRETTIFHAKSLYARIPHQRYFLSTLQRLRALMSHYPGILRPMVELFGKPIGYSAGAIQRGFLLQLPGDIARLLAGGLLAWRGPWRIKPSTVRLVDFLRTHVVTTPDEYSAIDTSEFSFSSFVAHRFTARQASPRALSAK
jgi:GT2 family glycosyltransferase